MRTFKKGDTEAILTKRFTKMHGLGMVLLVFLYKGRDFEEVYPLQLWFELDEDQAVAFIVGHGWKEVV